MKSGCRWSLMFLAVLFAGFAALALATVLIVTGANCGPKGERVGVVEVKGFIADSSHVIEGLKKFEKDSDVRAVVVRVETPGGAVAPSQEMHDRIKRLAAIKPVICSFGSLAASGGYYLSVPATRIVTNPGSVTGSIGVILQFPQYMALMDKLGLRLEAVKSGEFKDSGSPVREMSPGDRALIQGIVNDVFDQFVTAVSEGRKLKKEKVRELADGRIFTGRQAVELGLADQLGGFEDAVELAAKLGGITGEVKTEKWERRRGGALSYLLGRDAETALSIADPLTAPPIRFVLPSW